MSNLIFKLAGILLTFKRYQKLKSKTNTINKCVQKFLQRLSGFNFKFYAAKPLYFITLFQVGVRYKRLRDTFGINVTGD